MTCCKSGRSHFSATNGREESEANSDRFKPDEAVMFYFVDNATLKKKCPERTKILDEYVKEWTK